MAHNAQQTFMIFKRLPSYPDYDRLIIDHDRREHLIVTKAICHNLPNLAPPKEDLDSCRVDITSRLFKRHIRRTEAWMFIRTMPTDGEAAFCL